MNTWSQEEQEQQQELHESSVNRLYECKPVKNCVNCQACVNLVKWEMNDSRVFCKPRNKKLAQLKKNDSAKRHYENLLFWLSEGQIVMNSIFTYKTFMQIFNHVQPKPVF